MKSFHCTHCENLVFFENTECLNCHHPLAYLPDQSVMAALEQRSDGLWHDRGRTRQRAAYRLCANYTSAAVCNWAVAAGDPNDLCVSCRLTKVIPDLSQSVNKEAWRRLEMAKRRLVYALLALRLPLAEKNAEAIGLQFEFLQDSTQSNGDRNRVLTGHDNGLITINIAEADDVLRERQRKQQNEPYRTLLGHFRHEIGHYYWDRLILNSERLGAFRAIFGDERESYEQALNRHYKNGPPANWEDTFISAYASMHPWEDWAETWAHFMHMNDALETARSVGLSLSPSRADEPSLSDSFGQTTRPIDFDQMIAEWVSLTYVLNNLSRGLGFADAYPFVLSPAVVNKLRFVFDTVLLHRAGGAESDENTQFDAASSDQNGLRLGGIAKTILIAASVIGIAAGVIHFLDWKSRRDGK